MRALLAVDARFRQPEPFDWAAIQQMFLHDLLGITRVYKAVPYCFRINDHHGGVFALVQAARLIDSNPMLQASFLHSVFECAAQLLGVLIPAAWPGCGFVSFVETDKDMALKIRQSNLLSRMYESVIPFFPPQFLRE